MLPSVWVNAPISFELSCQGLLLVGVSRLGHDRIFHDLLSDHADEVVGHLRVSRLISLDCMENTIPFHRLLGPCIEFCK